MFLQPTTYNLQPIRGFTLIELMVTLAIFTIMTSVIMANYPGFNNKIALEVLAQDIALSIRQAQVYGISVRQQILTLPEKLLPTVFTLWGHTWITGIIEVFEMARDLLLFLLIIMGMECFGTKGHSYSRRWMIPPRAIACSLRLRAA